MPMHSELELRDPRAASTVPPCKASSARFGTLLHTEPDGDDDAGRRAGRAGGAGRRVGRAEAPPPPGKMD
eukprot:5277465-Alexandrium_andersonii.AAC.1